MRLYVVQLVASFNCSARAQLQIRVWQVGRPAANKRNGNKTAGPKATKTRCVRADKCPPVEGGSRNRRIVLVLSARIHRKSATRRLILANHR